MHDITKRVIQYWADHTAEAAEKKKLFLVGLAEFGSIKGGTTRANVDRKQIYRWRDEDEAFLEAWDAVKEDLTDLVERSLFR